MTAKSGAQAVAASVIGNAAGICLGWWVGEDLPVTFAVALGLSCVTQFGCYTGVGAVAMRRFDRERLGRVVDGYLGTGEVMSPEECKRVEEWQPWKKGCDSKIVAGDEGGGVGPEELWEFRRGGKRFHVTEDLRVYYLEAADESDILEGFFEARRREIGEEADVQEFVKQVKEKWLVDEVEVEGGWRVDFKED